MTGKSELYVTIGILIMGSIFKIVFVMVVMNDRYLLSGIDYCCTSHDVSKSVTIHLLENCVIDDFIYTNAH